jgi:hypothetical protein
VENAQESPETLIKVNPAVFGLPTSFIDCGYDSYEKRLSEKMFGSIPKRKMASDKMAIRVAHTFATKIVGHLVDDILAHRKAGLSDVQTYNRVYGKYAASCSDHIIRYSIEKIYEVTAAEEE